MAERIQNVGVLGAGTMGAGIAQVAAGAGCNVTLVDREPSLVARAIDGIRSQLGRLADRGKLGPAEAAAVGERLLAGRAADDLGGCELVIEAVFEDLAVKHEALAKAEAAAPNAAFATNTSSLSVAEIARGLRRPERLAGMHFFNPAPLMPLVEVIATDFSAPAVVDAVFATARDWGKTAVRARDVPGFIVNRVARPYYLEALRLLGDGIGGVAQIDSAMKALGFRMGPFELMDLVGIDVNYAVSCSVHERLGRPVRLMPHEIQRLMVAAGALGRKTGCGFYDYRNEPPQAMETRVGSIGASEAAGSGRDRFSADGGLAWAPLAPSEAAGRGCGQIQRQILFAVFNEAAYALDENVAAAGDIDSAMQKGTNYPKGPIAWTREIGRDAVRAALVEFESVYPGRFLPATAL